MKKDTAEAAVNEVVEDAVNPEIGYVDTDSVATSSEPYVDPVRKLFIETADPKRIKKRILGMLDAMKKAVASDQDVTYAQFGELREHQDLYADILKFRASEKSPATTPEQPIA